MGKGKTTTTTKNQLPAYMNEGSKRAVQMGMDISQRDYAQYDGQRVADLSGNEQAGVAGFGEEFGRYDKDFDAARGQLEGITSFTDEGEAEKYMNPYIEGVLQPGARRIDRAFGQQSAELKRTAGMRGAFGGRQMVAESLLQEQTQERLDDLWASGYGTAFDKATQLHGQEQDRKLAISGQLGVNAQRQADTNSRALRNMMESGFVDRTVEQSKLDFKYMEHLEERDWDVSNLNVLVQTLASVPHETTQVSEEVRKANPIKTLIGVATIAAGAILIGMTAGAATPLVAAQMAAAGGAAMSGGAAIVGSAGG